MPEILIVLGGPHCSALPTQTLAEIPEADIVCKGEGELTMAEIARAYPATPWPEITGICYRQDQTIHQNPDRPFIANLDTIPPPARHLLPMTKYRLTASRVSGDSYCPTIIVARGCPFKCTYCSRIFGKSFRAHSIPRIISEIQALIDTYHISQLNIEADTLTANRRFVTALCQAMIEAGFPRLIRWTCESRVDTVNADLLRLMRRAGCWQISYGVETGSQRLLDVIAKGIHLEQIEEVFRITKIAGIAIRGFFMLGLPTETVSESYATINFAKKLDPYYAQFTLTVPYPGTKMFHELDRQGLIRSYDWSVYNTWSGWKGQKELPYISPGRTLPDLIRMQKRAMQLFYLRPKPIARFMISIRSLSDIRKYAAGLWTLMKSIFSP